MSSITFLLGYYRLLGSRTDQRRDRRGIPYAGVPHPRHWDLVVEEVICCVLTVKALSATFPFCCSPTVPSIGTNVTRISLCRAGTPLIPWPVSLWTHHCSWSQPFDITCIPLSTTDGETKQTAKKSTGGSAPRKSLLPLIVLPPRASRSPPTVPDIEIAEEFDPSASNTGKALLAHCGQSDASCVGCWEWWWSRRCKKLLTYILLIPRIWCFWQWCHLCYDGNETLVVCDTCAATTCKRCIPALGNMPSSEMEKWRGTLW